VDLRLIFTLFRNMNIIFEAPFTIVVAIILLFNESSHYGFIGVYWFLIAFLLQRELDGRMMHCNHTKLGLIEKRSNLNYDLFDKIREAKLIGWEGLLTEKNNDLFIEENHDHGLFYSYATLYDITLLMLPIFVVSTITLYDVNEEDPITVEQVYLMLSLLGICYNPMKSVRTISINLHDGLHSLRRISRYFHFP
jgi:ABC-type multidrug transport system fused ATPase/permease subunit